MVIEGEKRQLREKSLLKKSEGFKEILEDGVKRLFNGALMGYFLIIFFSLVRRFPRGPNKMKQIWSLIGSETAIRYSLFFGLSRSLMKIFVNSFKKVNLNPSQKSHHSSIEGEGKGKEEGKQIGETKENEGKGKGKGIAAFSGGALAGLSLALITDSNNYQSSIALYLFVRALQLLVTSFWRKMKLPYFQHTDALIFILSCTEIMHAWFYHPTTIPAVYCRWITRMAKYGARSDFLRDYCNDWKISPMDGDFLQHVPCNLVHPQDPTSCLGNVWRRFSNGMIPSISIYTPVHTLPVLLLNPKSFIKSPLPTIKRLSLKILRSATFLSSFIGLVWAMVCLVRCSPYPNRREAGGPILGCFMCGFSVLIEQKSRRMELALKVLPDAITSLWRRGEQSGKFRSLPYTDVFLFSLALGTLSYYYYESPEDMKPSVRGVYRWCYA